MQGTEVRVEGRTWFVREAGSGPAVVIVHGLLDDGESWAPIAQDIARRHRVIVPDLPGSGFSDDGDRDMSAPAQAQRLIALLDELEVHSAAFVGHSFGSQIVSEVAAADPERCAGAVLMSSTGLGWHMHPLVRFLVVPGAGRIVAALGSPPLQRLTGRAGRHAAMLRDAGHRRAFMRAIRAHLNIAGQRKVRWKRMRMPVLIIWGGDDKVIPVAHSERQRNGHFDAYAFIVDGAGHRVHVDQPAQVSEMIVDWLGELRRFRPASG